MVVKNIQSNIVSSTLYFTPTIGSFLRIFFDLSIIHQPENLVRTASSNSSNHHIGIALLEKQLEISAGSTTSKYYTSIYLLIKKRGSSILIHTFENRFQEKI